MKLPVAELHIHLEGTLEPEMIMELAAKNSIELPYESMEDLKARYSFTNLQSFLDLLYTNLIVLRTSEDFQQATVAYLENAQRSGVRHVELFFDPQAHVERGLSLAEVVAGIRAGLAEGEERWGITHKLIACFWRHAPASEALELLQTLVEEKLPIDGIGLDSSEIGFPPSLFAKVYDYAREHGLHVVAHAGEEGPADYIWQALDLLKVERIDHGIRCVEDRALVRRLVAEQVPLTVCPLSNVRLRGVDSIHAHPLPQMLEMGLNVSVHSDDPAYFGGYMDANIAAAIKPLGLNAAQLAQLARNSFNSSFLDEATKQKYLAEVQEWADAH